ncbi:MAG: hypothetical protein IPH62_07475 [Ignavibacteriae bacterium]|nr:hypothetical protein [Ignavibacteriota bacterium]
MLKHLEIVWSNSSLQNALSIKNYLRINFSEKEIDTFYLLLSAFENAVTLFPELYPSTSKNNEIRRAVLSRELSAFYRIKSKKNEVLALIDNRCDLSKWL